MQKAENTNTTPAPNFSEAWVRVLAPSFETDKMWNTRPPDNKAMRAQDGAADRIAGLARVCWSLAAEDAQKGGARQHYQFLALTLGDIGKGLREAHTLWLAEVERQDQADAPSDVLAGKHADLIEVQERLK